MESQTLVYLVNTSDGQLLFNKLEVLVPKGEVFPRAFDLNVLKQDVDFSRFYAKEMVKLVSDPSRVTGTATQVKTPKAEDAVVIEPKISTKPSLASPFSEDESPETPLRPQIEELNQRVHAGGSFEEMVEKEGTDRDPKKPNPREDRVNKAELQAKVEAAQKQLKTLMDELSQAAAAPEVKSSPSTIVIEESVTIPKQGPVTPSVEEEVDRNKTSGDKVGIAESLTASKDDDEDLPLAVIPARSERAIDLLVKADKDPSSFKMSIAKSKDAALLRELLYGTRDKALRQYVHNRVKKLDEEMSNVE